MKDDTIFFNKKIYIEETASTVARKEGDGPLKDYFDNIVKNDSLGQKSYELAEIKLHTATINLLLNKAKLTQADIDCVFCGDLLDEIVSCNFTMKNFEIPFMGIYNACATFGEGLILGAIALESGTMNRIICSTSSHFSTAERQYRFPLELGNQRTPLSQWTVTGVGATMLSLKKGKVRLDCATVGRVVDYGVKDTNDMGGAMAPAVKETLLAHFKGTGRKPEYYDLIATGDLGNGGSRILKIIMKEKGYDLEAMQDDCGSLIYNTQAQKTEQGGSGAGCSSSVFNSYIYKKMLKGEWKKVLLIPTGALLSKTSSLQKQSIPSIAHAISFIVE